MRTLRNRTCAAACLFFTAFILASCTLSRRADLKVDTYTHKLNCRHIDRINVAFQETIIGKPLYQTVWDNAIGPFWDVKEAKQIGFTQNYSRFVPVVVSEGLKAASLELLTGVKGIYVPDLIRPELVETTIVVPFGAIFSATVESALENNAEHYSVCFRPRSCPDISDNHLSIKVEKFYVWEGPLNHLNFYVQGESCYSNSGKEVKRHKFEKLLLAQRVGTLKSTHASMLEELNRLANGFAQTVTTDIFINTLD